MHKVTEEANDLSCFTGAYGKSWVFSGSFLETENGLEIFSLREIQNLLGFNKNWIWPKSMTERQRYKYVGNSLSIPVVSFLLDQVFGILEKHEPKRFAKDSEAIG